MSQEMRPANLSQQSGTVSVERQTGPTKQIQAESAGSTVE